MRTPRTPRTRFCRRLASRRERTSARPPRGLSRRLHAACPSICRNPAGRGGSSRAGRNRRLERRRPRSPPPVVCPRGSSNPARAPLPPPPPPRACVPSRAGRNHRLQRRRPRPRPLVCGRGRPRRRRRHHHRGRDPRPRPRPPAGAPPRGPRRTRRRRRRRGRRRLRARRAPGSGAGGDPAASKSSSRPARALGVAARSRSSWRKHTSSTHGGRLAMFVMGFFGGGIAGASRARAAANVSAGGAGAAGGHGSIASTRARNRSARAKRASGRVVLCVPATTSSAFASGLTPSRACSARECAGRMKSSPSAATKSIGVAHDASARVASHSRRSKPHRYLERTAASASSPTPSRGGAVRRTGPTRAPTRAPGARRSLARASTPCRRGRARAAQGSRTPSRDDAAHERVARARVPARPDLSQNPKPPSAARGASRAHDGGRRAHRAPPDRDARRAVAQPQRVDDRFEVVLLVVAERHVLALRSRTGRSGGGGGDGGGGWRRESASEGRLRRAPRRARARAVDRDEGAPEREAQPELRERLDAAARACM